MSITDLSLKNRVTIFFLMTAAVITGLYAYATLPRELFPDVDVPLILIYTEYRGAAPAEVESQLTRPIERELTGLEGLKKLTSTSQEGLSTVIAEFVTGTDIDTALQKVRDRVDRAKPDIPEDAEEPFLQEISFSDFPVIQVHLSGDVGPVVLKQIAEDLQDELETIPGVLRVSLVGGREREVQVEVDPERLRLYGLALDDVIDAVRDENVSIPGGDLDLGDLSWAVRVPGEVDDPLAVGDFVIKSKDGKPIFVRDVASMRFGFEDRKSYARIDGRESVALSVQKRLGTNVIAVNDRVKAKVAEAEPGWPSGVRATLLGDLSKDIRNQVKDLENNILSGLVLVVLVLMFALGLRNAFFVGLAIPFSMLLTFVTLQLAGITLNMIVLFSLVLAVGMLVDNGIVVVENIYRHMQDGAGRLEAASRATREVGMAIAVSTFTTVGAFFPMLFWPGVIGDFMSYLPLTVSIALLASLVVAFTINPVLCGSFMKLSAREGSSTFDGVGARIVAVYRTMLGWALEHRALTVGGTFALFIAVLVLFGVFNPGIEFMPETEPNQIFVDFDLAPGTRLEKTDEVARGYEARLAGLGNVRVTATGTGDGSRADGLGSEGGSTVGRISFDLVDRAERDRSSWETLEEARRRAAELPGVTLDVDKPDEGPPVGDPLSLEISGEDFTTLGEIAARIRHEIGDIPGLVSLDDDFDLARPELVVHVDRTEVARLGLTTTDVANTIRTAINGTKASTYRRGEEEIDVTVRLPEASRRSIADLERLTVVNESGEQVPLAVVASIERGAALTSIRHHERERVVTVSGKVTEPKLADPVRREALRRIEQIPNLLPPGYRLELAGQREDEDEAREFLTLAFGYALLIVLVMIVAQFNSLAIPLIIMTSVVMSMIGVLVGLLVTDMPFGIIMTGVGVISLAGVVVNNAIVLLDYAEQLRERGWARRAAVIETGTRRLRPVLLTAITTILGLIPLTTGLDFDFRTFVFSTNSESSQYWRSMGVAVIFGLAFATFLTLVLVPVLYDLLLGWRERAGSKPARVVGRGAVDRGQGDVEQTEIDRELAAVMDQVADHEPA